MSQINGDKARFHRARKKSIARRKRTQELYRASAAAGKSQSGKKPARVPVAEQG